MTKTYTLGDGTVISSDVLPLLRRMNQPSDALPNPIACISWVEGGAWPGWGEWRVTGFARTHVREEDILVADDVEFCLNPEEKLRGKTVTLEDGYIVVT